MLLKVLLIIFLSFLSTSVISAHTPQEYKVVIKEDRFIPNALEILQGDIVTFINEDNNPHWPASNIHPSHSIYPEFDSLKGINPGENWSYRFEKAGSWRFHDHIYPEMLGTITVKEDSDFTPQQIPKPSLNQKVSSSLEKMKVNFAKFIYKFFPQKLNSDLAKFKVQDVSKNENTLGYWLQIVGGKALMEKLVADTGGGSIVDCHQEAHKLGRRGYELFGAEVFKNGHYGCHSGYYHGAMEIFLKDNGTDNLSEDIKNLCSIFTTDFGNFECLHGVGHGVLAYLDYDLPETIKECQKLEGSFAQDSCFGGMFMENIVTAQGRGAKEGHQTKWVGEDPHFPCNKIDQNFSVQTQCYLMQTSRMLDIYGYKFPPLIEQCMKAPQNMRSTCFQSIGRDAAGQSLRDAEKTIAICEDVPKEYLNNCLDGGVNVIIDFWGEGVEDQSANFCSAVVDDSAKSHCFSTLGQRLNNVFGKDIEKIKSVCALAGKDYQQGCLNSARVTN